MTKRFLRGLRGYGYVLVAAMGCAGVIAAGCASERSYSHGRNTGGDSGDGGDGGGGGQMGAGGSQGQGGAGGSGGCLPTELLCGTKCTDVTTDPGNCGGCGKVCDLPNAVEACVGGQCAVSACEAGFDDCDGSDSTGCESNIASDPAHCGACDLPCPGVLNGTAGCSGGQCTIGSCAPPFENCDGNFASGCDVNTTNSSAHCGGCGMPCPGGQGCQGGLCQAGNVIDTHNFMGMTEYPLDTDKCQCCGATTTKETADAICVLGGFSFAQTYTVGDINGTNCYCWDCTMPNQWASNCCSGQSVRPMILTVTCL